MEVSKLAKSMLRYLHLLVIMIVVITGVFVAKDLRQTSFDSKSKIPTLSIEQINPELSAGFGVISSCVFPHIYLSLPAKCKTVDG